MLNFQPNEKVIIHSTTDSQLDGKIAEVLGVSSFHPESTFYILGIEHTRDFGNGPVDCKAITLTEHCMKAAN